MADAPLLNAPPPIHPFGEADCESEIKLLQDEYKQYYFYHTIFNSAAMDPDVFLIVGRRGSGKTALSQYFSFQKRLKGAMAVDVDEPDVFQKVLTQISASAAETREVAIPRLARIWEFIVWSVVFREMKSMDPRIAAACIFDDDRGKVSSFIRSVIYSLLKSFLRKDNDLAEELEALLADGTFADAKSAALEIAKTQPVIVAFDTLENYAVHNEAMMRATAALIECASKFNREYAHRGVHLKLFMMAEVFPYLMEEVIPNTLKHIRDEVYLHWRPKDLMRLISWRFNRYLKYHGMTANISKKIDWEDPREVKQQMWDLYFGDELLNSRGLTEKTFPYVLRHTQLRPRQLIVLCNQIAKIAIDRGRFPEMAPEDICEGVKLGERRLAVEIISAYSSMYPHVGRIVDALTGISAVFPAKELDRRAPQTASEWPVGEYTPLRFRQLMAEMGIVGRVRRRDDRAGFIEADFEYATNDRLAIMNGHECVIHPMFFDKLQIVVPPNLRIYPFPDHQEFKELDYAGSGG